MKCLVTGGAGFIGSHLVHGLLKRGHDVRVFDNLSTGSLRNVEHLPIDFVEGDVRDDEAIVKEVERGEDYLKEKFEAAMKHKDLPPEARAAVDEAWISVREGHDQMSALKHAID